MEKLEQLEFNLDMEKQQRLQAEGELEVTKVKPVFIFTFIYLNFFYSAIFSRLTA